MFAAYIFDADGVLIPPWGFANYLKLHYPEIAAQTGEFFYGPFAQCLVGAADLKVELRPFLARWAWPHTDDEFIDLWFTAERTFDQELVQMIQTLRAQGTPCYLATNQEHRRAAYMRTTMGFDDLFDGIFASADLGVVKPDPAFYLAITQRLGVDPESIMFWDDAPAHVAAAHAFGWQAELYTSRAQVAAQITP